MKYYIGIDLGTSAVKLLLLDGEGAIAKIVSRDYPLSFPHPGWSEQAPEDWYEKTVDGLKELLSDIDPKDVEGLSFGGQMHGLVILDAEDNVIRPAILWNDGRTQEQTEYLNNVVGEDVLASATGNIAFAGFTAPKILWVKENEPENFAKIAKIMLPKDYLAYRLTGTFSTEYSDASGMLLLDVQKKQWSDIMLKICGIEKTQLPQLFESYDEISCVKKEIADALGLSDHVRVFAGAADNPAAALGTGTVGEGRCNLSLGTSGTLVISTEHFVDPGNHAIHSFCHADGRWYLMACMLSSASCNKWFMEDILDDADYAKAQEAITKLGENHVFFLPYLMGERCPHNDTAIRAMFYGMSLDTTKADMVQAVLEGVAFSFRDALEIAKASGISLTSTKICGGGAKSPLWRKILANVLDLKIEVIESEQGPGLGGALLAMAGCTGKPVAALSEAAVKVVETIEPEEELVRKYDEKYRIYREFYPALKGIM